MAKMLDNPVVACDPIVLHHAWINQQNFSLKNAQQTDRARQKNCFIIHYSETHGRENKDKQTSSFTLGYSTDWVESWSQ